MQDPKHSKISLLAQPLRGQFQKVEDGIPKLGGCTVPPKFRLLGNKQRTHELMTNKLMAQCVYRNHFFNIVW